jgi:hypothetical protein
MRARGRTGRGQGRGAAGLAGRIPAPCWGRIAAWGTASHRPHATGVPRPFRSPRVAPQPSPSPSPTPHPTPPNPARQIFGEVSELVQSALDGYHVCLFSYGQTGAGKTHTMQARSPGPGAPSLGLRPSALRKVERSRWGGGRAAGATRAGLN